MKTVKDFIFLGSRITADGDCNHEIKRRLVLGRKAMTNLVSILKSRDITLLTKVRLTVSCCPFHSTIYWQSLTSGKLVKDKCSRIVKAIVFLVCMYRCESWTMKKKAEYQRIDAFELWCWRRLLGVPWTTRRSNQSVLKEINP